MRPVPRRLLARAGPGARVPRSVRRCADRGWLPGRADPQRVRRAGLGITEGWIVLEEINRSGGHSAACHAQMYTMGALLKHGSEAQKQRYLPAIAAGRCGCRRSRSPSPRPGRTPPTFAPPRHGRRELCGQRAQELDQPHRAVRPALVLARTTPRRRVARAHARHQPVPGRPARGPRAPARRAGGHPGAHDVQLRHQRGDLSRHAHPGRQPDRRGGQAAFAM